MENFLPFLFFAIGLLMIIKGSDWFVSSAIWVARTLGVPDIIIGATLVSICTTLPEQLVSVTSVLKTPPNTELALSNALGSIACNTGLILPICVVFSAPAWVNRESFQRNGKLLVGLFMLLYGVAIFTKSVPQLLGVGLLLIMIWYMFDNVKQSKFYRSQEEAPAEKLKNTPRTIFINTLLLSFGITMTIIGANLLIENTEKIARFFNVPDLIIGITLTAFGTSLPELMTCITAMMKKAHNISIGNIIGADILNILVVIGGSSAVMTLPAGKNWLTLQFPLTLAILVITVACSYADRKRFSRFHGFLIFTLYAALITLTIIIS